MYLFLICEKELDPDPTLEKKSRSYLNLHDKIQLFSFEIKVLIISLVIKYYKKSSILDGF